MLLLTLAVPELEPPPPNVLFEEALPVRFGPMICTPLFVMEMADSPFADAIYTSDAPGVEAAPWMYTPAP